MSFGKNPHIAKAENEEQKARCARDRAACEQAWREAARQWQRASDRETDPKRSAAYSANAEAARAHAENPKFDGDGDRGDDALSDIARPHGTGRDRLN